MLNSMHWIDWTIVAGLSAVLYLGGWLCRRYTRGVADFLVAGRGVGRYLGLSSAAMAGLGGISILANWQMFYQTGFSANWWMIPMLTIPLILALTGFGIYRFRQSRVMTIAQLLEMRYSRRLRIYCGILTYIAGIVNMGIFPAVAGGFFVYFCGFPTKFGVAGIDVPTLLPVMLVIVGTAVVFAFLGGQVTVIITDFIQSVLVNTLLIAIVVVIYRTFTWQEVEQAFNAAPGGSAMFHPFHTASQTQFNVWFFMIQVFFITYLIVAWAPNSMLIGSAKDAHEGKMMQTILQFRNLGVLLGLTLVPLAAIVIMNHPRYSAQAGQINEAINGIMNEQVRSQMVVPAAVRHFLPVGVIGALVAIVFFASLSTHDTYLLAWAGVLIQDVIIPLRRKPFSPDSHVAMLRFSVIIGAVFIILFSLFFHQTENIHMFQLISGSIYFSGAGIITLGALYWPRGTTTGAWVAVGIGSTLSLAYLICTTAIDNFPLNGATASFFICILSSVAYIIVSLLGKARQFDLDDMLGRSTTHDGAAQNKRAAKQKWWQWSSEFSATDKVIFIIAILAVAVQLAAFGAISVYNIFNAVAVSSWIVWWRVYVVIQFVVGIVVTIWFTVGGIRDIARLVKRLASQKINVHDDGSVDGHHAAR